MTEPLKPETPAQIGSVVGVDRMDSIDRAKQDPRTKLELLAIETKNITGRDPRSGGFGFVCRPRIALQLFLDLSKIHMLRSEIRLQDAVVIGTHLSDVVGWWRDVPITIRSATVGDNLLCLPYHRIQPSKMIDRQCAGRLRMCAHYDKLESLREDG